MTAATLGKEKQALLWYWMNILHKYFDKIQVLFDKNVVPTNCNYLDKLVKTDYLQFFGLLSEYN